jgi:glycosyltransferase involved in cell wall biosynthesis
MKLIIQIPCLNEEKTLPITLSQLPRKIAGIDTIEVLIVSDGSTDGTVKVAKKAGVHHIVSFSSRQGLAKAFSVGLDTCLHKGADIIVNTDADNQYCGEDIAKLIRPILQKEADMVVGERNIEEIAHFSFLKKKLQRFGSFMVRVLSNTAIRDATSGFRAYSREAALKLNVLSGFSYTLETIIQARRKNITIASVSITTNPKLRESRLFSNMAEYVYVSIATMLKIVMVYRPLGVFLLIGGVIALGGIGLCMRFLYFYFTSGGVGHIQSLILAAVLLIVSFQVAVLGLLASLIGTNRTFIEDILFRIKKMENASKKEHW